MIYGIASAVLLSKRLFLLPAFGGVFYNIFIILGGVALGSRLGIESLAWGALAGGIAGPFLLNAAGAARAGMRYRPSFATSDAGFREFAGSHSNSFVVEPGGEPLEMREAYEPFLDHLRKQHPALPIVVMTPLYTSREVRLPAVKTDWHERRPPGVA